ncbi:GIY-YIG nuclease family protein [Coraliomargarita parva]|uniref:GIY-YIG nuclease family protein n=1 Tax=Coraliomargarita parva TaxID=3014050 RepID=UPI0022B464E4|nr:GIY-YIG nuclease family protein [Coraliomargarita parva]
MYYVYILENAKGRFYIGHTDDPQRRLREHNDHDGKSHLGKYTHKHGPWKLVWTEPHPTRSAAMQREKQIKLWKSSARIGRELLATDNQR